MKKPRSAPYSPGELNNMVKSFRGTHEGRVHKFRLKKHSDAEKKSTKTDWWDMPLTVCSCGSTKPPYHAASGRNCSALKTPHWVLADAYNNIVDNSGNRIGSIQLGSHPNSTIKKILNLKSNDSFAAGRCAEPHAVHRLLNDIDDVSKIVPGSFGISDILFSLALDARYQIAKPYCK